MLVTVLVLVFLPCIVFISSFFAVSGKVVFGSAANNSCWLGWNGLGDLLLVVVIPCFVVSSFMPVSFTVLLLGVSLGSSWLCIDVAGLIAVGHLGFVLVGSWVLAVYEVDWVMLCVALLALDLSSLGAVYFSSTGMGGFGPWYYLFLWWSFMDLNSELFCLGWFTKLGGFIGGFYVSSFYSCVSDQLLYLGSANYLMLGNGLVLGSQACGVWDIALLFGVGLGLGVMSAGFLFLAGFYCSSGSPLVWVIGVALFLLLGVHSWWVGAAAFFFVGCVVSGYGIWKSCLVVWVAVLVLVWLGSDYCQDFSRMSVTYGFCLVCCWVFLMSGACSLGLYEGGHLGSLVAFHLGGCSVLHLAVFGGIMLVGGSLLGDLSEAESELVSGVALFLLLCAASFTVILIGVGLGSSWLSSFFMSSAVHSSSAVVSSLLFMICGCLVWVSWVVQVFFMQACVTVSVGPMKFYLLSVSIFFMAIPTRACGAASSGWPSSCNKVSDLTLCSVSFGEEI